MGIRSSPLLLEGRRASVSADFQGPRTIPGLLQRSGCQAATTSRAAAAASVRQRMGRRVGQNTATLSPSLPRPRRNGEMPCFLQEIMNIFMFNRAVLEIVQEILGLSKFLEFDPFSYLLSPQPLLTILFLSSLISQPWSSRCGAAETNPTRNYEVSGLIPSLTQWVKDPALP